MFKLIQRIARNESGATAIEYGLIAAGIAMAIAVVVFTLGSKLNQMALIYLHSNLLYGT